MKHVRRRGRSWIVVGRGGRVLSRHRSQALAQGAAHRLHRRRRQPCVPDGLSKGMSPRDFAARQLARGAKVEREHTTSSRIAQRIAMDHLSEDPRYYVKLARMERGRR